MNFKDTFGKFKKKEIVDYDKISEFLTRQPPAVLI